MSALTTKQIIDLSWKEHDFDYCSCCKPSYHEYDYDYEDLDPGIITCPGCGTIAAPFVGFGHFEPECPEWVVMVVSEI